MCVFVCMGLCMDGVCVCVCIGPLDVAQDSGRFVRFVRARSFQVRFTRDFSSSLRIPRMAASQEPVSPFRNDILKDRVVLISGGATGIGFGCALCFGAHGAKVAIMSRRKEKIDEAVRRLRKNGIDAFGTTVDVRNFERCVASVNQVASHFGRIDFLINNAAGNFMVSSEKLSPNGLATVLSIDLQGSFHMSKACLPFLKKTGARRNSDAVIVNITATLQDQATPFQFHAASAKAGIDVLTNTIGTEWAEYVGLRVCSCSLHLSPHIIIIPFIGMEYDALDWHLEVSLEQLVVLMVVCSEKVRLVKSVPYESDVMVFLLEDGEE